MKRRTIVFAVVAVLLAVGAGAVTVAYLRRITPPWPATEGSPYEIRLAADGCPIPEEYPFVDAPGQLVPTGATEAVLCMTPNQSEGTGMTLEPRQRVLRTGVAEFVAILNGLPDRNTWWRDWQRKHSGFWPDAPPEMICNAMLRPYEISYVLTYPDRPPVAVIGSCPGLATGTRTRLENARPHLNDEFLRLFNAQ